MCLILIGWRTAPGFPLIIAANRDEFHARPTRPAHFWDDAPGIVGGRDLQQGGTWLACNRDGRFAAVANYREPELRRTGTRSRGLLVSGFLRGTLSAGEYLAELATQRGDYDPFNLIAGDGGSFWFLGNREPRARELPPGIYGISNGELDCPWPKVTRAKNEMQRLSHEGALRQDAMFALLTDRSVPDDQQLPDTGIGLEWERRLAPIFVSAGDYGTRSSSVILRDAGGRVEFEERSFDRHGALAGTANHRFTVMLA